MNIQCNNCRAYGHIARFCLKRGRGDTKEATGNSPAQGHSSVSVPCRHPGKYKRRS